MSGQLCTLHHRELHTLSGVFKAWDGHSLKEWQLDRIAETRERCIPLLEPLITEPPRKTAEAIAWEKKRAKELEPLRPAEAPKDEDIPF